jgi:hypothetical protein
VSPLRGRALRLTIIGIVVGCLVVAALVVGSGSGSDDGTAAVVTGARVPSADSVETAWYCAEGTGNPGGRADERLYVANVDSRPGRARVSVMQGPDTAPKVTEVPLAAGSVATLRVGDLLPTAEPGVLVEVTGARAVVSHSITGNRDGGVGPCARDASTTWHFAAGTTVRGAQLFLALFNPFADDAIADIAFLTQGGPLAPEDLQGFVIPARSRVTVSVHDFARRDDLVATEVAVRRGRVVAEQSQTLDGSDTTGGRRGLSLSLGAPALSRRWEIANGSVGNGRAASLLLANPGSLPTNATIRTRLDGGALEPETVSIPARSSIAVDVGRRVPAGVGFSLRVDGRTPIVAETFDSQKSPAPTAQRGIATEIGATRPARRWIDLPARATSASQDAIAIANPNAGATVARVRVWRAGKATTPPDLGRIELAAGKRTVIDLARLKVPTDAFVEVTANRPVVVDRMSNGMPGLTEASTIPDYDR